MDERPPAIVILVYGLFLFLFLVFVLFLILGFISLVVIMTQSGTALPDITQTHI
jgi:hypothetical protein